MKNILLAAFLFCASVSFSQTPPFTNINAGMQDLGYSWATWGDYDKDGDLDVILCGDPGSTIPVTKIYRNDNGVFTDINTTIPGLNYSSAEWGDYDGDGDLDLLMTGRDNTGNPLSRIYRNDNGIFNNSGISLPPVAEGQAVWGDYDNDGDPDILMAGNMSARVIRNDGNGQFTDIGVHFTNVQTATACWGDYNNDGWLDALIAGDSGGGIVTKLYRNDHGTFTEDSVGFKGLSSGQAKWADLDNDGYLDLLISGLDDTTEGSFLIYKNNGDGTFTTVENYTFSISYSSVDIADYDNDGMPDILLVGRILGCGGTAVTMLYHNEGYMVFFDISTLIPGIKDGNVAWGDYNNDGYTDILYTGQNGYDAPVTAIFRNNLGNTGFAANTAPGTPQGLLSAVEENRVTMNWQRSFDAQTSSPGLTYNLFVGTSPDSVNVLSPLSDPSTGFRKVAVPGNAGSDTLFIIRDLQPGNYFWSVQAVDNAFTGSVFAPVQSFTVLPVGVGENNIGSIGIYPNPFRDRISIRNVNQPASRIEITDELGKIIYNSSQVPGTIDLSFLPKGIYLVRISGDDEIITRKLMKE
jgi:hypothetical protein